MLIGPNKNEISCIETLPVLWLFTFHDRGTLCIASIDVIDRIGSTCHTVSTLGGYKLPYFLWNVSLIGVFVVCRLVFGQKLFTISHRLHSMESMCLRNSRTGDRRKARRKEFASEVAARRDSNWECGCQPLDDRSRYTSCHSRRCWELITVKHTNAIEYAIIGLAAPTATSNQGCGIVDLKTVLIQSDIGPL